MQKLNPRIVKNLRKAKLQKNHGSKLEFLQIGKRISIGNISFTGNFSENDSVDVFALEIVTEKLTRVGFSIKDANLTARISVQRLNQSSWSIEEFSTVGDECEDDANWSCGEIDLGGGLHAIRLERVGISRIELSTISK